MVTLPRYDTPTRSRSIAALYDSSVGRPSRMSCREQQLEPALIAPQSAPVPWVKAGVSYLWYPRVLASARIARASSRR